MQANVDVIVPVKFHIVLNDDGTGPSPALLIDEAYIETVLSDLEQKYSTTEHPFDFITCGSINYIHNSAFLNGDMAVQAFAYQPFAANVYVLPGGSFSDWPWSGMSMTIGTYNLLSSTLSHEFGHHFGLIHTYDPSAPYQVPSDPDPALSLPAGQSDHPYNPDPSGRPRELVYRTGGTLPPGAIFLTQNCEQGGDLIFDTPAACRGGNSFFPGCAFNSTNCTYTGTYVDYNGMPIDDPGNILARNIMSGSTGDCRQELTPEQHDRVLGYYEDVRVNQYQYWKCGNLSDRVEYKGTDNGLERVSVEINNFGNINRSVTSPSGDFDGILHNDGMTNSVTSIVKKLGPNPDFSFEYADWIDGVTTYDLVLVVRHILNITPLDGYNLIAADVNNSGTVTTYDAVLIRKLILNVDQKFAAFDEPWRYIPEYIPLNNPTDFDGGADDDPFQYELTGTQPYPMIGNSGKAGFDGVKLGDVNDSNTEAMNGPNLTGEGTPVYIDIVKTDVNGKLNVDFKVQDFTDIVAYRFDITFEPQKLSYKNSVEEDLSGVHPYFFGATDASQGLVRTLWYDEQTAAPVSLQDFQKIFKLVFDKVGGYTDGNVSLATGLGFRAADSSAPLRNYAISADGTMRPIIERHYGEGQLASIQSVPNPFGNSLNLLIEAIEKGSATVNVFSPLGQRVYRSVALLDKGGNNLSIEGTDKWPDGFYFVAVEMEGRTYTEKIVKTD